LPNKIKIAKERIDARNALENYMYSMRNTVDDPEKLGNKLGDDEKSTIKDAIKETQSWIDSNQSADKEAFDEKLKEIQGICDPIVSKVYKQSGGGPGENVDTDL